MQQFTVTENHLKLIKRLNWTWNECETGAPSIDPKRPFGNSYVPGDVRDILGEKDTETCHECGNSKAGGMTDDMALEVYYELLFCMQILTDNLWIKPGVYKRDSGLDTKWFLSKTKK